MKPISLLLGLVAFPLSAMSAEPGTTAEAKMDAGEIAPMLGIEVKSFNFTFDEPVYCRLTFSIRAPGNQFPIGQSTNSGPAKTMRVSFCFARPKQIADALGLKVQENADCKWWCSLRVGPRENLSSFGVTSPDPFNFEDGFRGVPGPPPQVKLDTDVVVYGMGSPSKEGVKTPQTLADFLTFPRSLLIIARFSKTPFPP